jgi:catechol 2,3-dioxygenase-like lactoylglutathione lyase family enzyme
VNTLYPVICSADVAASRDFYTALLGLRVVFDSGWYVQLQDTRTTAAQLGIVETGHSSVPARFGQAPAGVLISVEVDDATAAHRRAVAAGLTIAQPLRDEVFGQRHFMTVDPDGLLVDVIEPIDFDPQFAAAVGADMGS